MRRSGLQSYCISSIHGGQKEDDCKDAGGRATQGAVAEEDRVGNSGREQRRRPAGTQEVRATQEHDYRDVGVRVTPGAVAGAIAEMGESGHPLRHI